MNLLPPLCFSRKVVTRLQVSNDTPSNFGNRVTDRMNVVITYKIYYKLL